MKPVINFYLEGKCIAIKNWGLIPRVGDTVMINKGKTWVEVIRVIWAEDTACEVLSFDRQWVQLVCKTISDPTQ